MTAQNKAGRARLHLIVSGRVQGVGFRFSAYDEAKDLALAGWVRNVASGGVEIVAEGKRENLQMLAAWAHLGPPSAHVTAVREDWLDFTGEFTEFRIR
ncbi:MAG TPA: acylphosphatase [Candidatus Binatus sp.]|uniref:acylphosphatase n=1 Tax=Candidatus Binatus sp. TaxID=2811406 RepID=UPI002B4737F1|nr:acylphosphatase [Candidatus Binatus sp.]HKN13888.1 acylphosphatase [Candidatus Binatus sp.]